MNVRMRGKWKKKQHILIAYQAKNNNNNIFMSILFRMQNLFGPMKLNFRQHMKITKLLDSVKYFCLLCGCISVPYVVYTTFRWRRKNQIEKQRKKLYFAIKSVYMFVLLCTLFYISIACPNKIQFVTIDTKWTSHKACIQNSSTILKTHEKKMVRIFNGWKRNPLFSQCWIKKKKFAN